MVVQHNLTAMNSNRMLGITTNSQAKATEKLSSGYKINRAADDAAGLAISEKMRKQIRGLTQASSNAQDGISSVQTAEGALTEVHDMLQRMNELAVKAANGTMSESDRDAIQSEVDQLVTEIERVSTTTKFNETYLLKGSSGGKAGEVTYNTSGALSEIDATKGSGSVAVNATAVITPTGAPAGTNGKSVTVNNTTYYLIETTTSSTMSVSQIAKEVNDQTGSKVAFTSMDAMMAGIKRDNHADIKTITSFYDSNTLKLKIEGFTDMNAAIDFSLHVGADSSDDNKINLNISAMSARNLGINGLDVSGDNDDKATAAIDVIADALQKVSDQRATLGAVQNRLEHTIANLDNVVENTTAAESAIRDTDMATQMVTYSNNQILAQAGQAVLAQSNQSNQGVLSLLG